MQPVLRSHPLTYTIHGLSLRHDRSKRYGEEILALPHPERHRWVKEISEINKKINQGTAAPIAEKPAQPVQPAIPAPRPRSARPSRRRLMPPSSTVPPSGTLTVVETVVIANVGN